MMLVRPSKALSKGAEQTIDTFDRAGGRPEGDLLLMGAIHFDHAIDRGSLR